MSIKYTNDDVSVILTIYSERELLDLLDCLEYLEKQTCSPDEVVIVINSELYHRIEKVNRVDIVSSDEFTIMVHNDKNNLRLSGARNKGAKIASGDIYVFIDADVKIEDTYIEELINSYNSGAIAVGGPAENHETNSIPKWLPRQFFWLIGLTHFDYTNKTEVRNTFGCNISFRADVFENLDGFSSKLGKNKGKNLQGEETFLCNRMRKEYNQSVTFNPEAVVYHKVSDNQLTVPWLSKRAFWQGYSKQIISSQNEDISLEKSYLYDLFMQDIPHLVQKSIDKKEIVYITQVIVILYFTFLVGIGYLYSWFD